MEIYINDIVNQLEIEDSICSLSETTAALQALSAHKDSFLEITDVYEDLIRFSWVAENKWLIDHPVEVGMLHQQGYASTDECLQYIEKIYQEYDIEAFEGFVDVPIGEFTLDEVLAFKATEDEIIQGNDDTTETTSTEDELETSGRISHSSSEGIDWFAW